MPNTQPHQGIKRQHCDADQDCQDGSDVCWVCLDTEVAPGDASLFQPCKCPRMVHPLCLARWQLRSAGRDEEKQCRFCHYCLPDWRISIQTRAAQDVRRCGVRAPATMTVAFCGKRQEMEVEAGPDGFARFLDDVRSLFGISADLSMDLNFDCVEPTSGHLLQLNGSGAFDAAVHCAAMAAASRARKRLRRSTTARRLLPAFLTRSASCASVMEAFIKDAVRTAAPSTHCRRHSSGGLDLPATAASAAVSAAASIESSLAEHPAVRAAGAQVKLRGHMLTHSARSPPAAPAHLGSLRRLVPRTSTPAAPGSGSQASGQLDCAHSPLARTSPAGWGVSPDFQLCHQWTTAAL